MIMLNERIGSKRIIAALIDLLFYFIFSLIFNIVLIVAYFPSNFLNHLLVYFETGIPTAKIVETLAISSVITLVLGLIYYVIIPFYAEGQTLGKKILLIKVVNRDFNNPSFFQYILRTTVLWPSYLGVFLLFFLFFNFELYSSLSSSFSLIIFIIWVVSFFMILLSKDQRAIHDLISNTFVIPIKEKVVKVTYSDQDWEKLLQDDSHEDSN